MSKCKIETMSLVLVVSFFSLYKSILVRLWNKQLYAYVNHARIRSWIQPVLSNESKVSYSMKQREPLMRLEFTTDRYPPITSQTRYQLRDVALLVVEERSDAIPIAPRLSASCWITMLVTSTYEQLNTSVLMFQRTKGSHVYWVVWVYVCLNKCEPNTSVNRYFCSGTGQAFDNV